MQMIATKPPLLRQPVALKPAVRLVRHSHLDEPCIECGAQVPPPKALCIRQAKSLPQLCSALLSSVEREYECPDLGVTWGGGLSYGHMCDVIIPGDIFAESLLILLNLLS